MPFTKETAKVLGRQGGLAPKPKNEAWNNIVGWLAGEGGHKYSELLARQASAVELSDPEKEFMDRFYTLLEFHQPKLARKEITGKDGKDLIPKPIADVVRTNFGVSSAQGLDEED